MIKGGRIVDADGERDADVLVSGTRIAAVGPGEGADRPGAAVLDASGCLVAPGLVDLHTHLRQPGREEAETIETGARAAALGGYTAVLAMPNTTPAIDGAAVVREVLELGSRRDRATCTPRARSPWGERASSSPRWPRWRRSACASSPTTAPACRTTG